MNKDLEELFELHIPGEQRTFIEMALIGVDRNTGIRVDVQQELSHPGLPYFRAYNMTELKKGETGCIRLYFKDNKCEYHNRDGYPRWSLTNSDIKHIKEFMQISNNGYGQFSNWQVTCWQWNLMNMVEYFDDWDMKDYINGGYDSEFDNDPRYVRSDQPIPDWIYNPPKSKSGKRTTRFTINQGA